MIEINRSFARQQWEREKEDAPVIFGIFIVPIAAVSIMVWIGIPALLIVIIAGAYYGAIAAHIINETNAHNKRLQQELKDAAARVDKYMSHPDDAVRCAAKVIQERAEGMSDYLPDKARLMKEAAWEICEYASRREMRARAVAERGKSPPRLS